MSIVVRIATASDIDAIEHLYKYVTVIDGDVAGTVVYSNEFEKIL